jgi:hypothetical protein
VSIEPSITFADGWSPRRVALLRRHHGLGLTATQSADLLGGVTRNAVMSKRRRLGLEPQPPKVSVLNMWASSSRRRLALLFLPDFRTEPLPTMASDPPPGSDPKRLCDRRRGECAWPLGPAEAPGDYRTLFCCAPIDRGGSRRAGAYCAHHRALARRRV